MADNHEQVSRGFRALLGAFAPYLAGELKNALGDDWWARGVMDALSDDQKRDLPPKGDDADLVASLDPHRCLLLFDRHWHDVFRKKLSQDHRTWAKELMGVRNKLAHLGSGDVKPDYAWRALDTMSRLCDQMDAVAAEELRGLLRAYRYGSAEGSTAALEVQAAPARRAGRAAMLTQAHVSGLPSWRDVIHPHPDVAEGRYKNAEFAADLAQVARGEGTIEYRDPVEFFARTFVTEGMSGLLEQALRRVCGRDGEPVIQLKTAFGGGKTHSLLALYHLTRLTRCKAPVEKMPNVGQILQSAGVQAPPRANVAVLVGTALDPNKSRRPQSMPEITINTLWGEMAAQLAESAGNPKLYDLVKESDRNGVSPGSETLKRLFDAAAPSVVLMDELVAYARKIHGAGRLPAGTFDNLITFIQELTEAARASKNSLVVASIPESEMEIGGEAGRIALETIEHTIGRLESVWKPVSAGEGFEVVRRRLFLDCRDPARRDDVCARFGQMYFENQGDFPPEAHEVEYRDRMLSCYPIHPELFDRLYEDWATLEKFQRTRGVLRLMAATIYELWMGNDAGPLIMPGSIPLDAPNVRYELMRNLSDGERWSPIVDREVDGRRSIPFQKDQSVPRFGRMLAARRVARTIMLGSAPTGSGQGVRGVEASHVRLGVAQPGENIAIFNDALGALASSLSYLYTNPSGDHYWYDTRPTLRKYVEDRATQMAASDVEYEIETRLRGLCKDKEPPFAGIHVCPPSSLDVPDEQRARLVVLRPADRYRPSDHDHGATVAAAGILDNRGDGPRVYRNTLAFLAPDRDTMGLLEQTVRRYLAWKSIRDDSEQLNLDAAQNRETKNNLDRCEKTIDAQISEAYCWLIVPHIDRGSDMKTVRMQATNIRGGSDRIIPRVAKRMLLNEEIVEKWAPALLLMELDELLWRDSDHIAVKKLWEQLCTYCYLPRLADEKVLHRAIRDGLNSRQYFAYASGLDGGRYIDLKFGQGLAEVEPSGHLVKVAAAQRQIDDEARKRAIAADGGQPAAEGRPRPPGAGTAPPGEGPGSGADPGQQAAPPKSRRFFMTADMDTTRINRDVQNIAEEIIRHLAAAPGAKVKVWLEVEAVSDDGFGQQTVRTVSENCRTLRVRESGFEE